MSTRRPDATAPRARTHGRWALLVVFACALGQRIAVHQQIADGPLHQLHLYAESDMAFHHLQATRIAEGAWLQLEPMHPTHAWHREVARAHFRAHPEARLRFGGQGDPAVALWNEWYGGVRFHQEPLYTYLLALTYACGALGPRSMLMLQLVFGAMSQVLTFAIARRHFGSPAAWVAVALSAAYAPTIAHELVLLRTAPEVCLSLAVVALADRARDRDRPRDWMIAGLVAGIAVACRAPLALLLLGVGVLAGRAGGRRAAAFAVGAMLGLLPVAARNAIVGAPIASVSSVAAVTFACQNVPGVDPLGGFTVDAPAVAAAMDAGGGRFFGVARASWARHADAWSVARMVAGRTWALVADREVPGNTSVELARRESPLLALAGLPFGAIVALAAAGLLAGTRRSACPWALVALVVAATIPQWAFYATSRFRAPLVMALLPFAGGGVVGLICAARARRLGRVAIAGVLATVVWLAAGHWPELRHLSAAELATAHEVYYHPAWAAAHREGNLARATELAERALALGGPEAEALQAHGGTFEGEAADHALIACGWWTRLGITHAAAGKAIEAQNAVNARLRLESRLGPRRTRDR